MSSCKQYDFNVPEVGRIISKLFPIFENLDKTVGFRLGGYKAGDVTVMEPTDCNNIPQAMKDVTKVNKLSIFLTND